MPSQITQEHPLYIDVFPIPYFRKRILALRRAGVERDGEGIFDEEEFTRDIDADGIAFWGADSSAGVKAGAPWDHRSWECRPWFLRKWWMLTGWHGWRDGESESVVGGE